MTLALRGFVIVSKKNYDAQGLGSFGASAASGNPSILALISAWNNTQTDKGILRFIGKNLPKDEAPLSVLKNLIVPQIINALIDKADEYKAYRRSKDEEAKVLDRFRDPNDPLEIVIVTAKLLTGFDAPILQVMYLDKPMKDHTLLQAICRTNRTYDEGKTHGLIVDYIGIFDNVESCYQYRRS